MAVPKKKTTHRKQAQRRAQNFRLAAPTLVECSQCGSPKLPHHVCPTCGYYAGRQVVSQEAAAAES
ncbi:MAG: 50S ribosomal protein L32 [Firmicutes bacterium]|nr:50S ribosomal protein L32 [Bacillota bacterium]